MMPHKIRSFLAEDKAFFSFNKKEIAAHNNRMLTDGCVVYAIVLAVYTILTSVASQPDILRNMYYAFDVVHAALCLCVFKRPPRLRNEYKSTQRYCALLELSVLGFFVLEAVYVSRTQHSLYVPIAIIMVILLYEHSAAYTVAVTFAYAFSYALLACLYKTPEAYFNDLYIAIATFISANIGYVLVAKMRHREGAVLRKYEKLSNTDMLTGLYNKSAMESLCERVMSEAHRSCAFIILDLDDFKGINDAYGHDVGDEVLRSVGRALQASFREMDYIGRFGGDEFIVLMDGCDSLQAVEGRIARIMSQISCLRFPQSGLTVQCSAGIAVKKHGETFQDIFRRADQALYEAKAGGKEKYSIAEDS